MTMSRAGAAETRIRLIEAGIDLLCQLSATDIVSAVGTRDIASRAGVSSASFFHHFGSVDQYTDELMKAIYSTSRLPRGENVSRDLETVAADDLPVSSLLVTYRNALTHNLSDPEYRLKHGLWSLGGQSVDSYYRDYLDGVDALIETGASHMLGSWGREPRPPFDLPALIAVGNALAHGAYTRHILDPELFSIERFAIAVTGTVLVGVRLKGDHRNMSDRLAEMNYYPRDTMSSDRPASPTQVGNKEHLLSAAAELFSEFGFTATSVEQLAKRAGVSTSTFFNLFGSKSGLAVALLDHLAELHLEARKGYFDPENAVVDRLISVADLAASHPELAKVFLAEFASDESGIIGATIVDPLAAFLKSLPRANATSSESDYRDIAQIMITVAMQCVLRRPGLGAESAARWAMRMVHETASA